MPVSVCRPSENPLESVPSLVSLLQKIPVLSLLFLQRFKIFHTVDYPLDGGERMIMLITRIMQCNLIPT